VGSPSHARARSDGDNFMPVGTTALADGTQNRMGYGYIGSSEAATDQVMRFSCADSEVGQLVAGMCHRSGAMLPAAVNSFIQHSATPAVIEGIRAKIYEELYLKRYAMQRFPDANGETEAALNGAPPPATADDRLGYPNHCMHWNQTSRQGQARFMRLRREHSGMPEDRVIEGLPSADKKILYKAKAVTNHWDNANVTKAVVLHDYFRSARDRACANHSSQASACSDLQKKMTDLETSYPIFGTEYASELSGIRSNIHSLYGVESMRRDDNAQAETSGRRAYELAINRTAGNFWANEAYPKVIDQLEGIIRRQPELAAPQGVMAQRYTEGIRDSVQSLKQKIFDNDNRQYWSDTCDMNLTQLIEKYPNAVRQYMVDASPEARRLGQVALCHQSNFTPLPTANCEGVSRQPDGSIKVNSHTISYPYGSDRRYTLTPTGDPDVPYEVSMNMHFKINPELYTPPPRADRQVEVNAQIAQWKTATQGFYECQFGNRATFNNHSCPPGGRRPAGVPKLRFNFNFQSSSRAGSGNDTTTIELHKCFNADAPMETRTSCRGVERYNNGLVTEERLNNCAQGNSLTLWYQPNVVAIRNRLTDAQRTRLCSSYATSTSAVMPPSDIITNQEIITLGRLRFGNLSGNLADPRAILNAQPGDTLVTDATRDQRSATGRISSTSYQIPTLGANAGRSNTFWVDESFQMPTSEQVTRGDFYARIICLPDPSSSTYHAAAVNNCRQTMTHGSPNRANAGNYTLNQGNGTVFHEVGHIFGLDDEYLDPTYPYTPQGEHNSIMNSSDNDNSRLFPRHLKQLISPLSCPAAQ